MAMQYKMTSPTLRGFFIGFGFGFLLTLLAFVCAGLGHGTYIPLAVSSSPLSVLSVPETIWCIPLIWGLFGFLASSDSALSRLLLIIAMTSHYLIAIYAVRVNVLGGMREEDSLQYLSRGYLVLIAIWLAFYVLANSFLWRNFRRHYSPTVLPQ
jgi:hypothetical protein